jgi:glycosyltransferase involved in cell wall biosynthesis
MFDLVRMGAPRARVSLVPCGVDLDRFRPDVRATSTPKRRRRFRLLCVSRLVERKGLDTAIDAVALLPDAELVIAGGPPRARLADDPEGCRLIERAARLGLEDRVRFTGQVAQHALPALYRSADLVVCTPWYEPFGMVPLEAMACGVPAVVAAVGGLVDTVIDGVTGLHVPPRDPEALAGAINVLLGDASMRAAMARRAALRARDRYGWETIAGDTMHAYVATTETGTRRRRSVG